MDALHENSKEFQFFHVLLNILNELLYRNKRNIRRMSQMWDLQLTYDFII
jgi:hypothetical protein